MKSANLTKGNPRFTAFAPDFRKENGKVTMKRKVHMLGAKIGGVNLPDRINTKAKWIAECGAVNVNAATLWIDGTSILG